MARSTHRVDKELEEFRTLVEPPATFEDGFNWMSFFGVVFMGLLMVPGAIYMTLLAGGMGMEAAVQWVTVILFIEVARRAHRQIRKADIFVLFFMAAAMMTVAGGAAQVQAGPLWQQFFARSDAAVNSGIAELLPRWFAPDPSSSSYAERTFFHVDWLPVLGLIIFGAVFSQLSNLVLGYGLFRLTSDVEKLPFPMAPIGAQGIMALAEDIDEKQTQDSQQSWRWRVFSIGGALGLAVGAVYLLLPTLSGALTGKPIMILPIPFSDWTAKTETLLPTVAIGMSWDLGNLIMGMVLPFYAMVGSLVGLVVSCIGNPILYDFRILKSWSSGDDMISILFKNNVDFYFSFSLGVGIAIALVGFYQVYRNFKVYKAEAQKNDGVTIVAKKDRGDIRTYLVIACYFLITAVYLLLAGYLIDWHRGVMTVLVILCCVYMPLISYVNTRLEGIAGNMIQIPLVHQAAFILSGYRGVAVWFLPIPRMTFSKMALLYRQCELTGTKFSSLWKAQFFLFPIILIMSILFSNFIWGLADVPSAVYPYAQKLWDLQAANSCIMYSSTLGEYSIFEEAFDVWYLTAGAGFGVVLFSFMGIVGAPIFMTYGVIRGLGQAVPHLIIPQFIGALIGRYYFQRKFGLKWRQYIPVVAAGFGCGAGLIATAGIGITFLSKSVIQLPF